MHTAFFSQQEVLFLSLGDRISLARFYWGIGVFSRTNSVIAKAEREKLAPAP